MSSYEPGSAADPVTVSVRYGDAWALAETLEAQSIDCIVTSPPYWGLRDYGHPDQFGLERTPQEYVAKLVDLFARLRPALKDEGTVWLNLGDCYATSISTNGGYSAKSTLAGFTSPNTKGRIANDSGIRIYRDHGLKPKDLVGIPWRVALALQEDGWYLRSDIIWAKPNPMPESVRDRPTKAHEYLFLLAKSERYYFDQEAVKEPAIARELGEYDGGPQRYVDGTNYNNGRNFRKQDYGHRRYAGFNDRYFSQPAPLTRNIRTVWTITPKPYKGAHFATFPPKLIEPCIKAGCPEGGTVLDPFMGSGTTAEVARKLGRNCIGFELNENYRPLIDARVAQAVGDLRCRS